jgi:hypothetical protein
MSQMPSTLNGVAHSIDNILDGPDQCDEGISTKSNKNVGNGIGFLKGVTNGC